MYKKFYWKITFYWRAFHENTKWSGVILYITHIKQNFSFRLKRASHSINNALLYSLMVKMKKKNGTMLIIYSYWTRWIYCWPKEICLMTFRYIFIYERCVDEIKNQKRKKRFDFDLYKYNMEKKWFKCFFTKCFHRIEIIGDPDGLYWY